MTSKPYALVKKLVKEADKMNKMSGSEKKEWVKGELQRELKTIVSTVLDNLIEEVVEEIHKRGCLFC